jgi:hypothetical protein
MLFALGRFRSARQKDAMASGRIGAMVSSGIVYAISGGGVVLSALTATAIASFRFGSLNAQVKSLQAAQDGMARKEDLTPIKETLAEIKGMFRLELKDK